jgi:hypothetical protein
VSNDHETNLRELLDREAIRDVYARYARGLDRVDAALLSSAYHPDAVEDHHGETYYGDTIGEALTRHAIESMERSSMHFTTLSIATKGDKAGCEAYYLGVHLLKGGEKRLFSSGRTFDRLERRDGAWRFIHRIIAPDMVRILPADEITIPHFISRRDPSDPSYEVLRVSD